MEDNKKNVRIFYITMAVILAVVTILIIATVAARRNVPEPDIPNNSTDSDNSNDDEPTLNEDENTLPTFILPVEGKINIDFSDTIPVFSQTMNDYRTHLGVDIDASLGSDVLAVADGTVTNVWDDPFMGTCISIEHSGNAVSIYKNLAPTIKDGIIIGASVKSGDVIGAVGESAMNEIAEEPHLHYELKVDNKHVDPKGFLKFFKQDNTGSENNSSDESNQK